jgi:hypothetical protein
MRGEGPTLIVLKVTLIALLCISIDSLVFAQTARAESQKIVPTSKTDRQSSASNELDLTAATLPPNFKGQSIPAIWNTLNTLHLGKSEYETNSQYQERVSQLSKHKLLGNIPLDGVVAIVVLCDDPDLGTLCSEYNSETRELKVTSPIQRDAFLIEQEYSPRREAGIGQNAFGVKRRIYVQSRVEYYLTTKVPEMVSGADSRPVR